MVVQGVHILDDVRMLNDFSSAALKQLGCTLLRDHLLEGGGGGQGSRPGD